VVLLVAVAGTVVASRAAWNAVGRLYDHYSMSNARGELLFAVHGRFRRAIIMCSLFKQTDDCVVTVDVFVLKSSSTLSSGNLCF
jgi:hypothetical protein